MSQTFLFKFQGALRTKLLRSRRSNAHTGGAAITVLFATHGAPFQKLSDSFGTFLLTTATLDTCVG